MRDVGMIKNWQ